MPATTRGKGSKSGKGKKREKGSKPNATPSSDPEGEPEGAPADKQELMDRLKQMEDDLKEFQ
jgi:hypothetical protein